MEALMRAVMEAPVRAVVSHGKTPLVEIVGPPGVGKSTIYKALCKKWSPECNWVYQDALLAPAKPSFLRFSKWLEYNYKVLAGKRRAKSVPVEYGLDFIQENQALADFCWAFLSDTGTAPGNGAHRYRAAYFLFGDFCRYQALQKAASTRPCVIEEGFLQKSFLVQGNGASAEQLIDRYINLIPLPRAIIYIDAADKVTITNRLTSRPKTIASHIGKGVAALEQETEKWQCTLGAILGRLHAQHVDIYKVDGEKTVEENVQVIRKVLQNL
ncbi:AAA family ATPase [Pontibacter actiniarum]|nr:AAA family ATPase [Pontibacter actiniarum]